MKWQTVEKVVQNTNKQWYLSQAEVAVLLGRNRRYAAEFLAGTFSAVVSRRKG